MKRFILLLFPFMVVAGLFAVYAENGESLGAEDVVILGFINNTGDENYTWIEKSLPKAIYDSLQGRIIRSEQGTSRYSLRLEDSIALLPGSTVKDYGTAAERTGADIIVTGTFKLSKRNKKITILMEVYQVSVDEVIGKIVIDSSVDTTLFKVSDNISADILAGIKKAEDSLSLKNISNAEDEKEVDTSGALFRFGKGALCVEGDCINGTGRLKFPGGEEYNGEFENGYISGKGKMTWPNGDVYKGAYASDMRNGMGVFSYHNGDIFTGNYANNIKNGYGEYRWKNGDIYSGEWKNGKITGRGTYIWSDGTKYSGEWKDGRRHGEGIITWPDSRVVVGTFVDNILLEKK